MYYTSKEFFINTFNKNKRSLSFSANTIDDYFTWKNDTINKLKDITGFSKIDKTDITYKITEIIEFDYYIREKVIIQTTNGLFMPLYILKPKVNTNNIPVIAIHGHGSNGKNGIVGIIGKSIKSNIDKFNYLYALELVEKGFTVFCPDICGSGERREKKQQGEDKLQETSCNNINNAAISVGMSLIGITSFELTRLIDYIYTFNDLNFNKLICVGFSGGGLAALWLSAFDDRIKCSIISGYFHGFKETIMENNLCGCNFVPNLWNNIDICDLGALIAPRKLFIESGDSDNLNGASGLENVYSQVEITKKAYKLFDKEENIVHSVCQGGHKWYGSCYDFIDKYIEE